MWEHIVPWTISFFAFVVALLTYLRNGRNDSMRDRAENDARMESLKESLLKANIKLDQMCAIANETRNDVKSLNQSMVAMDKRLSVVENDLKTAFMRIDELREEVRKYGMDKG